MSRSTSALIIAILLHLIVLLIFVILEMMALKLSPKKEPEKKEHRVKVSLKEQPKVKKEALVKNSEKPIEQAMPMPKGEQLKTIVKKPLKKYEPAYSPKAPKKVKKKPKTSKPAYKKPKTSPVPSKKPYVKVDDTPDFLKKRPIKEKRAVPQASSDLYSLLSQQTDVEDETTQSKSPIRKSQITQDIKEMYGDKFGELSAGEQKYILDNQEIMRRITQRILNRVGSVNIPRDFSVNSSNTIEFYLHPNGDISDIKFIEKSKFYLLDETTKETIEYAYSRYPRPKQKTLIRYKVGYYLQGY
ncbi:MAG: hypothetical protein U9N42_11185 [Campylobacterota bacterium]|nr:hypothetical protein [Campylobacterota bacterium]